MSASDVCVCKSLSAREITNHLIIKDIAYSLTPSFITKPSKNKHLIIIMKLKICILLVLAAQTVMVQCAETDDAEFSYDHAFRQFEGFLESRQNDQIALEARDDPLGVVVDSPVDMIDRMGSADGEILVDVESLGEETNEKLGDFEEFLRKVSDSLSLKIFLKH